MGSAITRNVSQTSEKANNQSSCFMRARRLWPLPFEPIGQHGIFASHEFEFFSRAGGSGDRCLVSAERLERTVEIRRVMHIPKLV
jgi:hypothetical protein